jgi:hypothetical protein
MCAGVVAATIVNANPFRGEHSEPVSALDFMGEREEPSEEEKAKEFLAFMGTITPKKA